MTILLQKLMILVLMITGISAMAQRFNNTDFPFKSIESDAYGTDVLIQGKPSEDQRSTKIAAAANGTLYAGYIISNGGFRIARSVDNGTTWSYSSLLGAAYYITAIDITVTGADSNSMNVWVISTGFMKSSIDIWDVTVEKLNQHMTLLASIPIDQMISNYGFPDVAIATDFDFPSVGASPFSIGILYSKIGAVNDNVIFKSSADGGSTFTNSHTLASTGHYFINVALGFGRSPSLPEGRYFAAWDKQPSFSYYSSCYGKIYTSHTLSQFNGTWSGAYRLDTIGGGFADGAKDPSIACQADQFNNFNNAFTVVVMYDKMLTASGSKSCVFGAGNLDPVAGNPWSSVFTTGTGNISDIESDVTYDPIQQNFYVTWSDSLNAKLKCAFTDMDLSIGGSWTQFSNGYNDAVNIDAPFPRIKMNTFSGQVVNVWNGLRSSTIANATFDQSGIPVGIVDPLPSKQFSFSVSPNPCSSLSTLSFTLVREEVISVNIFDLMGRRVSVVPSQTFPAGSNQIAVYTDHLKPACYLVQLNAGSINGFQRLVVIP